MHRIHLRVIDAVEERNNIVGETKDICPIVKEPKALTAVIDLFEEHVRQKYPQTELIVGLEARGFLFGPLLSQRLGIGFVPVRKKGKLPGPTVAVEYVMEKCEEVQRIKCGSMSVQCMYYEGLS
ncbi:uncharacterized protein LOC134304319 isoform X2 [Trichomycterus rosablanca]|uniref:uncharacterized protein LOC134304319 isoform X2 n=1 Tax=Trichomycterus rosablanca TaxID=2290929 RepID=UPI002F353880